MNFKIIKWNLFILIICLFLLEFILYLLGYKTGITDRHDYFEPVKYLVIQKGFDTDESGIQIIAPSVRTYIAQKIIEKDNTNAFWTLNRKGHHLALYNLSQDYVNIHTGKHKNDFYYYMNNSNKNDPILNQYFHSPINPQGFRSIEFINHISNKKKVLLLGDSFTFGHSANNKTDSFADILLTKDYLVYNSGITATDIPQYEAIAKKYIEIIKPDYVISSIFLGNDINKFKRKVSKEIPIFYKTNAGFLNSCSTGIYFNSADSIYNHLIKSTSIPQDKIFNKLMSKTRITTRLWDVLDNLRIFNFGTSKREYSENFWNDVNVLWDKNGYSPNRQYLENIDSICQVNNAVFITSIIPQYNNFNIQKSSIDSLLDYFPKYHLINNLEKSDYSQRYQHFNNSGHKKYGDYLDSLIQNNQK